ncbi:MAG TPA: FAD-dependent oxidoreductase, partial [Myxococcota bacterium]|nr:FAD-dependent oxidoreductase [Myxococcota bacterium]
MRAVVIGAGVFGAAASVELRRRGWDVVLVDAGAIPHPLAESTDISKVVRLDYGPDEVLTAWMEEALDGWRDWNGLLLEPLFREIGLLFLTSRGLRPGSFEGDSLSVLDRRGHDVERLDEAAIARRFPAWARAGFTDGYFQPQGGYAEASRAVSWLVGRATAAGVEVRSGAPMRSLLRRGGEVRGVLLMGGIVEADVVVVTAGSWTQSLVPELAGALRSTGHAVVHMAPREGALFQPEVFPVFCADIARTGWYGFPMERTGVVKIGRHGVGRAMHPESTERVVTADEEVAARGWARQHLPALADAPIVHRRVCVYGDSLDGDFWIDHVGPRVVVAAGGSGHGFKFAPVLGPLIADVVEDRPHKLRARFAARGDAGAWREAARS